MLETNLHLFGKNTSVLITLGYKELSKALMHRTKLQKILIKFFKEKTTQARLAYKRQRKICATILRKSKWVYFENLDIKNLKDKWKFCGNVKPLLSNKVRSNAHITLSENDQFIGNEYVFQISELKLISNKFTASLKFLSQSKKLSKNTKTILISLLLKHGIKCWQGSDLLFHTVAYREGFWRR